MHFDKMFPFKTAQKKQEKRGRKNVIIMVVCMMAALGYQPLLAQYNTPENNIWAFGQDAGLEFSNGMPHAIKTNMEALEGCASIGDNKGTLLFYTNGTKVWDRTHQIMANGNNVHGDPNRYPTNSTTQSSLIVPFFNESGKYFLFTLSDANTAPHYSTLSYSVIDISLNNGLGGVIADRKNIFLDSGLSEKMTAIQGDHCNIWLLVHAYHSNLFKAYEITQTGISPNPVLSVAGGINPPQYYYGGVMKGSPNRKLLMSCTYGGSGLTGAAELFHFDPGSGRVSNYMVIDDNAFNRFYGAEFSADNSKLYLTGQSSSIFQYDLSSDTPARILNSVTDITQDAAVAGVTQGDLKLGPDGKIYVAQFFSSYLGIIADPDKPGSACKYSASSVLLSKETEANFGLPNVVFKPSYSLSATIEQTLCYFKDSVLFSIDANAWDIVWDDGSSHHLRSVYKEGLYKVNYYTAPCIYHEDSFLLRTPTLMPQFELTISGCKSSRQGKARITPSRGDTTGYTFTWKEETGRILKITNNAVIGDTLTVFNPGKYTLSMHGNGCDTLFTFELPEINERVSFNVDSIACVSHDILLNNTSTSTFITWTWDFDDGHGAYEQQPRHRYSQPGVYKVQLTGSTADGCSDTFSQLITVDAWPPGVFSMSGKQICTGMEIQLTTANDSTVNDFMWETGHDHFLLTKEPSLQRTFDFPGRTPIKLLIRA